MWKMATICNGERTNTFLQDVSIIFDSSLCYISRLIGFDVLRDTSRIFILNKWDKRVSLNRDTLIVIRFPFAINPVLKRWKIIVHSISCATFYFKGDASTSFIFDIKISCHCKKWKLGRNFVLILRYYNSYSEIIFLIQSITSRWEFWIKVDYDFFRVSKF